MYEIRKLPLVTLIIALVIRTSLWGQVPVEVSDQKIVSEGKVYYMHEVLKGQTLYSISRAYKVSIDMITGANEIPESGIQTGQILKIPVTGNQLPAQPVSRTRPSSSGLVQPPQIEISDQKIVSSGKVYYMHEVKKGQTLYSIAKSYKVTIIDITRENVIPSTGIYAGQMLKIPASSSLTLTEPDAIPPARPREESQAVTGKEAARPVEKEQPGAEAAANENKPAQARGMNESETYRMHRVRKGETLYSISRDYNVTVGALLKVNDIPRNEIREGQMLKIPAPDYEVIVKDEAEAVTPQQEQPAAQPGGKSAVSETPVKQAEQQAEKPQTQQEVHAQPVTREPAKQAPQPEKKKIHKVQKGESLSDIAKKYGITLKELKDANKGVIFAMPDMKLVIPVKDDQDSGPNK
jgi:LysM repeat protein